MKRVTINLTDAQFEELQLIVEEKDSDVSKQIRKAIAAYLERRNTL